MGKINIQNKFQGSRIGGIGSDIFGKKDTTVQVFLPVIKEGRFTAIVPNHKEITIGTLSSILKQAGLTTSEFHNL